MPQFSGNSIIKKEAKKLLSHNRIAHIAVFFCFAVCVPGILFAGSSVLALLEPYLSDPVYLTLSAFFTTLVILTAVPLFYGVGVFEYNVIHTGQADTSDLFYAFGSARMFRRSFFLFWGLMWRFLLIFSLPLMLADEFFAYVAGESMMFYPLTYAGYDLTYLVLSLVLVLSFIACTGIYARYASAVYLTVQRENLPVSLCFAAAGFAASGHSRRYFALITSFLPLIFLSLITLGVLLVLHTIPLMLLAVFLLAADLCETKDVADRFALVFDRPIEK